MFRRFGLLPLALLLRGETSSYSALRALRVLQFDRAALAELRRHRLKALLRHSVATVPHYRSLGIGLRARLDEFPILAKDTIATAGDSLRSEVAGRASPKTSGGSTGQPVTVWKSQAAIAQERAATWLAFEWYGITPGDRCFRFWGTGGDFARRRQALLGDLAMNRITASAFAFGDAEMDSYWRALQAFKPKYVYGYVSMLDTIARRAATHGLRAPEPTPRVVITTSEALHSAQRHAIESAFGAPVRNEYGCGETGPIAYECTHGTLHTCDTNLWIETVDDCGTPVRPGYRGRLLITDLTNHAMPLIRYEIGDSVEMGDPCTCGRALGTLRAVLGRSYDFLEDRAGRRYHGEAVMYVFEDLRKKGFAVQAFKVQQRHPGSAHVLAVLESQTDPMALRTALIQMFADRLGGCEVDLQLVTDIPRLKSGKAPLIERLPM